MLSFELLEGIMEPKILRLPAVKQLTQLSKASIYRLIHAGQFPCPVKLGQRAVGWHLDEIENWLAARFEGAHLVGPCRYLARCPVHDDKKPSLAISDGENGVLVHCFAGCSTDLVLSKVGLNMSDLFYEKSQVNGNDLHPQVHIDRSAELSLPPLSNLPKLITRSGVEYVLKNEFVYENESVDPVLSVGRYESGNNKTFLQFTRQNGSYRAGGLKNRKVPAYKLPSLLERPDSRVYVVEGEKCAETLYEAIGEPVTCWAGGSNAWSKTDWSWIKGRDVTLLADEDESGRKCMRSIAAHLQKLGANSQLLCPSGDSGRDIADVINEASEDDSRGAMAALAYIGSIQPEPVVEALLQADREDAPSKVLMTSLTTFNPKPVDWLVEGWLPAGHMSLLAGQAGMGKTTLAIDLCARLTRGKKFPDGSYVKQCEVAYWSGEDSLNHTIVPRLLAAGAYPKRIRLINGIEGKFKREFQPATDLERLEVTLCDYPRVRVVVLDPVIALIMGARNANAPEEVRKLLEPVRQLVEHRNIAILGIHHFAKRHNSLGSNPLDRVIGSQAWGGIARVVWAVDMVEDERVLARAKNNLSVTDGSLTYKTVPAVTHTKDNSVIHTSRIEFGTTMKGDANSLFIGGESSDGSSPAVDAAHEFLKAELAAGKLTWKEICKRGKSESHTESTLRRAREKLKGDDRIRSFKVGGSGGAWYWELKP